MYNYSMEYALEAILGGFWRGRGTFRLMVFVALVGLFRGLTRLFWDGGVRRRSNSSLVFRRGGRVSPLFFGNEGAEVGEAGARFFIFGSVRGEF